MNYFNRFVFMIPFALSVRDLAYDQKPSPCIGYHDLIQYKEETEARVYETETNCLICFLFVFYGTCIVFKIYHDYAKRSLESEIAFMKTSFKSMKTSFESKIAFMKTSFESQIAFMKTSFETQIAFMKTSFESEYAFMETWRKSLEDTIEIMAAEALDLKSDIESKKKEIKLMKSDIESKKNEIKLLEARIKDLQEGLAPALATSENPVSPTVARFTVL